MSSIILLIHIAACILLILVILLQVGKGAGLGNLFGGGGSDTILTSSSGNVILRKITVILAIVFAFTSITLTLL